MKKVLLILFLLAFSLNAQVFIFGTNSAPSDTATLTDDTELASRLIFFNGYPEGAAALWMDADSLTGDPIGVVGKFQLYYGVNSVGDTCWGVEHTLTDSVLVKGDINNPAAYGGSTQTLTGRETVLPNDTNWGLSLGVKFYFTGVGTQTSLLIGKLLIF